jgi:hypothetical protein
MTDQRPHNAFVLGSSLVVSDPEKARVARNGLRPGSRLVIVLTYFGAAPGNLPDVQHSRPFDHCRIDHARDQRPEPS